MVWMLTMVGVAWAATPVIYEGTTSPDDIVAAVAAKSGLPVSQLGPLPVTELLKADPEVLGDGALRRCSGERTDNGHVRTELARAESAWQDLDRAGALDRLDLAVGNLGCLKELVDARIAARVFLFRGALAADAGDDTAARGELRTALGFEPGIAWIDRFPEGARLMLEEERASASPSAVRVIPPGTGAGPWLDGRILQGDRWPAISLGLHLVQYSSTAGITSAWLAVAGDATLVIPHAFRRPVVARIGDPGSQGAVEALLAATIPDLQAAYVAHETGLWLVTREGKGTSVTQIASASSDRDGKKKKKKNR